MKHEKIKRLKSRRCVKIRAVRFTRQKRRSVDIVAGSAFCFEEKNAQLACPLRSCGGTAYFDGNSSQSRRIATAVHAAGSARLFVLSRPPSLPCIRAGGRRAGSCSHGPAFFYCHVPPAAFGSSAGSCGRSSVGAFTPARQLKCSELVSSILCALRCGTAALHQKFLSIKSA